MKLFSEITLHWNFDDFLLKLDFVYHVSGVPLCFCSERSKIFLIQKDLKRQKHFQKQRHLPMNLHSFLELYSFLINVQEGPSI